RAWSAHTQPRAWLRAWRAEHDGHQRQSRLVAQRAIGVRNLWHRCQRFLTPLALPSAYWAPGPQASVVPGSPSTTATGDWCAWHTPRLNTHAGLTITGDARMDLGPMSTHPRMGKLPTPIGRQHGSLRYLHGGAAARNVRCAA